MNNWTKIQKLAQIAIDNLETRERDDGEKFICWKDRVDFDGWLYKMSMDASGDMMADDFRYRFMGDALYRIFDHDDWDTMRDNSPESDVYNHDLLKWVSSDLRRAYYVDEVLCEYGLRELYPALSCGQVLEKEEVENAVYEFLKELDITLKDARKK